jgi:hypothetical protein
MAWELSATGFGPLSWEAWTAIGTWLLAAVAAIAAWAVARRSQRDARAQIATMRDAATAQVAAAEQAALEQRDLTERMAQAHLDMLREDLRARLLLHYATVWDSARMIEQRKRLAGMLLSSVQSGTSISHDSVSHEIPNFFESVGLLVGRGQLDSEMVWHTFGYCAMRYGRVLRWFFTKDRETRGDPHLWTAALELLATLQKAEEAHTKRAHSEFARDEVIRFLREETQAAPALAPAPVRPGR